MQLRSSTSSESTKAKSEIDLAALTLSMMPSGNNKRQQPQDKPQDRSKKSRESTKDKIEKDLADISVLFILEKIICGVTIEDDNLWRAMPFAEKRILNLDIFELNNVGETTNLPYGEKMTINHDSSEEAVQLARSKVSIHDQVIIDQYITPMGEDGSSPADRPVMPCAIQAIAFSFVEEMKKHSQTNNPKIYFVKRDTLMGLICYPSLRKIAFNFMANNFRYVYGGNSGNIHFRKISEYAEESNVFTEKSQWHHLLDFLGDLALQANINLYPPIRVTHSLDDKYNQKKLLGPLGLPGHFLTMPIVPVPIVSESHDGESDTSGWGDISWEQLYDHLKTAYPFGDNYVNGLVIKPRYGGCGYKVVILELIFDDDDNSYTIKCRQAQGDLCDTPNDYIHCTSDPMDVILEPFCPNLLADEHRIFMMIPNKKTSLEMFAYVQANMDFDDHEIKYSPLDVTTKESMEVEFPSLSRLLLERLRSIRNCTMITSGIVYRVDIFAQGNLPRVLQGIPAKKQWRINEMDVVPNAHVFVSLYHHNGTTLTRLGAGFKNYIIDNYTPYYPV